jgi:CRP-like cAMP-binding protein
MNKIVSKETYKDGQVILSEGTFGEGTYVVLSGKVSISKKVGEESISITELQKNDIFGEVGFINKEGRSASVTAVGDVQVGLLDKDFLDNEFNKTSSEFQGILKALTERVRKTTQEMITLKAENYLLKNSKLGEDRKI